MQQQQQQLAAAAAACATLFLLYRGSAVVTQSMRWTAFLGKEGALEAERLHTAAPSTRGNTPLMFCLHIAGKKDANNHGVANAKHIVNAESQTMAQAGRKRVLLFGDTPAADVAQVSKAVSADLALSISRTEEKAFYSRGWLWKNAYYPWSGMHGSPVKPFTVRWLATLAPPEVRYLWVVEDDVLFTGDWEGFFSSYEDAELGEARGTKRGSLGGSNGGGQGGYGRADLLAVSQFDGVPKEDADKWYWWKSCSFCTAMEATDSGEKKAAFLPVFRISKRLATAVQDALNSGLNGHHEALVPSVCESNRDWCTWKFLRPEHASIQRDTSKNSKHQVSGLFRWKPPITADTFENGAVPKNTIVHPVKDSASMEYVWNGVGISKQTQ